MKIHYILIAIVLTALIGIGGMNYLSDFGSSYNATADYEDTLNVTKGRLNDQLIISQELSDDLNNLTLQEGTSAFDVPYIFLKTGWDIGRLIFNSWNTLSSMISESGETLQEEGIPLGSTIATLIAVMIFIVVGIVIYALFKWKWED